MLERLGSFSISEPSGNGKISKKQFCDLVFKRIVEFKSAGLKKNQTCSLLNNNTINFFIDLFALFEMEARPIPLGFFGEPGPKESKVLKELSHFVVNDQNQISHLSNGEKIPELTSDLILTSSGTTGSAKLIGLKKDFVFDRAKVIGTMFSSQSKKAACFLPSSFGHGLISNSLVPLVLGLDFTIFPQMNYLTSKKIIDYIQKNEIDTFSSVPMHLDIILKLVDENFAKGRNFSIHCASSPLRTTTYEQLRKKFSGSTLHFHYGMTELSSWMTAENILLNQDEWSTNCVGKKFDLNYKIRDEQVLFDLTSELLIYNIHEENYVKYKKGDEFNTYDLGHVQEEKLYITGRVSDFINKFGIKISPFEIEDHLKRVYKDLDFYAVPLKNDKYGEEVGLVVIGTKDTEVFRHEIRTTCLQKFEPIKIPSRFLFLDKKPEGFTVKISRYKLAQLF